MPPLQPLPRFDLYRELEVDTGASTETIEAAWRSLARRHHPDVSSDPAAARERMRRLNVAHEWLTDPSRRARYDLERGRGRSRATARPPRQRQPEPAASASPAAPAPTPSVAQPEPRPSEQRWAVVLRFAGFYAGCVLWVAIAYVGALIGRLALVLTNAAELVAALLGPDTALTLTGLLGNLLYCGLVGYGCAASWAWATTGDAEREAQSPALAASGFLAALAMTFGFPAFAASYLPGMAEWLVRMPMVPAAAVLGVVTGLVVGSVVAGVSWLTRSSPSAGARTLADIGRR